MSWEALVASATGQSTSTPSTLSNSQDYYDDDEYTDDDYESVEMAAWGENAKTEPASWNNLIDTSVKVKAGGVGSGDLHRRGGNFKPLSEAAILAQRLNKPIPGRKNPAKPPGASSKKKKKAVKPPVTTVRKPYIPLPYKLPERRPASDAPPSTWGSKPLVETPFWEVKKTTVPPSTPVPNTSYKSAPTTSFKPASTASLNQPAPATIKPVKGEPVSVGVNTSFIFKDPETTKSTLAPKLSFNPDAPGFTPAKKENTVVNTLPVKKSVKITSPTPSKPLTTSAKSNPLLSKQLDTIKKSLISEEEKPYVHITLEIGEGISAVINLYKDSDPNQVAEDFGKNHNLIVTDTTKKNLARTFTHLINTKKNKEQQYKA